MSYTSPSPKRSALIVCPSYNLAENDEEERFQNFLVKAGLHAKPLKGYDRAGASRDVNRFIDILQQYEFVREEIPVIDGIVSGKRLTDCLARLLENTHPKSVAVFCFCGHGSHDHGSMLLSRNLHFTSVRMNHIICSKRFSGTFISILNMCDAQGVAPDLIGSNSTE